MLKKILSIAGRPGLYTLVGQGKNMLIVEQLGTSKRTPAYASDKVVSLGDITIYTNNGDMPLFDVFEKIAEKNDRKNVDVKAIGNDAALREYFGEIIPDFDHDRVYNTDIKKIFQWYNTLVAANVTEFKDKEIAEEKAAEAAEAADDANKA